MIHNAQQWLIDRGILTREFSLRDAVEQAPAGTDAVTTVVGAVVLAWPEPALRIVEECQELAERRARPHGHPRNPARVLEIGGSQGAILGERGFIEQA